MKLKLLLFTLIILTLVAPANAQDPKTKTVRVNNFEFTYDTALAMHIDISTEAKTVEEVMIPTPENEVIMLYSGDVLVPTWEAPIILRVYRIEDLAEYEFLYQEYLNLQTTLTERPDLNTLDYIPGLPGKNAAQVLRARGEYVDLETITGVRFISSYAQAYYPILSDGLIYEFQGISKDGLYYVAGWMRLNTALFPTEVPADFNFNPETVDVAGYFDETSATITNAAATDFTPSLDTLNAMIDSFTLHPATTAE